MIVSFDIVLECPSLHVETSWWKSFTQVWHLMGGGACGSETSQLSSAVLVIPFGLAGHPDYELIYQLWIFHVSKIPCFQNALDCCFA